MIHTLIGKAKGLLYDLTVGLIKEYKRTSIELARIELATYYVKTIKLIRQECLISTLVIFGAIMFSNALGVIQMAIIMYAPMTVVWRIVVALLLGMFCSIVPLFIVLSLFSQDRWMRITKADEVLEKALGGKSSIE